MPHAGARSAPPATGVPARSKVVAAAADGAATPYCEAPALALGREKREGA